jgi:hypothetical protein
MLKDKIVAIAFIFQNLLTFLTDNLIVYKRPPFIKNAFTRMGFLPEGHEELN